MYSIGNSTCSSETSKPRAQEQRFKGWAGEGYPWSSKKERGKETISIFSFSPHDPVDSIKIASSLMISYNSDVMKSY